MYGKRTVVDSDIVALLSEVLTVVFFEKYGCLNLALSQGVDGPVYMLQDYTYLPTRISIISKPFLSSISASR